MKYSSFGGWKWDQTTDIFWVYILRNSKGKLYVGQTKNIKLRLERHNKGTTPQTTNGRPWEIAYTEVCFSRETAVTREKEIKKLNDSELLGLIESRINDFESPNS